MFGLNIGPSTVIATTERCVEAVAAGPIVNCDETGTRAVIEVERESDRIGMQERMDSRRLQP